MRALILVGLLALAGCQAAGSFDPVKTQVGAHNAHAATATAASVAASTGALKGSNAAKTAVALDQSETVILVADSALGVAGDPSVVDAKDRDKIATRDAEKALKAAS